MQILTRGTIKHCDNYLVRCIMCESVFSFTEFECAWRSHDDVDVFCPHCGYELRIDDIDKYKRVCL